MKKLLITGAYGLVGSNICKVLERDYPEIEITKVKCDELYNGEEHPYHNQMHDFVIYAGGYGQPQMFGKDKIKTIEINTTDLIRALKHLKPEGKFLFISSSEIYSGAPSPHKETDIGTTTPQHPRACYIEGKRCGEAICMAYKEQGYDVKIARLALAYGPGTKKHDTRVINEFIEQALVNKKIVLKDRGDDLRTYCYIDDAVSQLLSILFHGSDVVYNVGGESTISIANLAKTIAAITLSECYVPDFGKKNSSPDLVRLDMSKTLTEFPPEFGLTSIESGLIRTIEYQKELYGYTTTKS